MFLQTVLQKGMSHWLFVLPLSSSLQETMLLDSTLGWLQGSSGCDENNPTALQMTGAQPFSQNELPWLNETQQFMKFIQQILTYLLTQR